MDSSLRATPQLFGTCPSGTFGRVVDRPVY
jgi:hypothetical protein